MFICKICNKEFSGVRGLVAHVWQHHQLKIKEYYDNFVKRQDEGICACGENTTFRNFNIGYLRSCSIKCNSTNSDFISALKKSAAGKSQSEETIRKRIVNTDQVKKQLSNMSTIIQKYGVDNIAKLDEIKKKISNTSSGRKAPRANILHQQKIIESKRNNGTLRHRKESKIKISQKLLEVYQTEYNFSSMPIKGCGGHHKSGQFKELYFRSSYEFIFIKFCKDNCIEIECAANQKWRVRYSKDDKLHFYYPDFYLPQFDVIIEIKPLSRLNEKSNILKIEAARRTYHEKFVVLTENDLINLNEHFLFRQLPASNC